MNKWHYHFTTIIVFIYKTSVYNGKCDGLWYGKTIVIKLVSHFCAFFGAKMYHCVSSEIISGDIPVKVFGWGAADAVRPHQTTYLVLVVVVLVAVLY